MFSVIVTYKKRCVKITKIAHMSYFFAGVTFNILTFLYILLNNFIYCSKYFYVKQSGKTANAVVRTRVGAHRKVIKI